MPSTTKHIEIPVELGDRTYQILIGENLLDGLGPLLEQVGLDGMAAVVSSPTVWDLFGERVMSALGDRDRSVLTLTIAEGEENKSLETVRRLYDGLLDRKFERSGTVIALGGGTVGDTAGFVAATLLRGVNFVQVPTTILSQVDSAIGGKVGVNHAAGKNLIGAIYQPRLVVADTSTLGTLPPREVRSGLAEIIKYGVIRDAVLFEYVEAMLDDLIALAPEALRRVVTEGCRIKAAIVREDERELRGLRTTLNFGHTIGHALESLGGFDRWRHGEAVAIGMAAAAQLATRRTGLPGSVRDRIVSLLRRGGFSFDISGIEDSQILERTRSDKKVSNRQVRYVLPVSIGEVQVAEDVPQEDVVEALDYVRGLTE